MTATIDSRGRVTIPAALRKTLGLREGDTVQLDVDDGVLHVAKADETSEPREPITDENLASYLARASNPIEGLAMVAEADARAGRTIPLEEYADQRGLKRRA
jgi:AbrB family looped-hinge helix DNA binding protein